MKFLVLFAIMGLALAAPPTKEELEKRATELEAALSKVVDEVRIVEPIEARILETEIRELKVLSGELATAANEEVVRHLERRLQELEGRVTRQLNRLNGITGTPPPPTTKAPPATTKPAAATTKAA